MRFLYLTRLSRPKRYRALFETIHQNGSKRLVEIGVLHGAHARQMIYTASLYHPRDTIYYYGFDLFEDLTPALLHSELSKQASPYTQVQQRLEKTGAHIQLFKGNTKETLPQALPDIGTADFIFVDGGHSIETIQSDWRSVKELMDSNTSVIFDDYYVDTTPELEGLGCQTLLDQLDRQQYTVNVLKPTDVFRKSWGLLKIKMAVIKKRN
jgi:hypothetical protein